MTEMMHWVKVLSSFCPSLSNIFKNPILSRYIQLQKVTRNKSNLISLRYIYIKAKHKPQNLLD